MADVSVEFGAQDVGLEKTLKQVQAEMTNLEGKVKSGELTMTELESTMKRLGQVQNLEKKLQSIGAESAGASPKVDALSKDIKGAGDAADKTGTLFDLSFAKVAAATAVGNVAAKAFTAVIDGAFAAARATVQGFTDALDLGGRLNDLSARTGETAGNVLLLERAFDNAGAGADKVGPAINRLQKFIEEAGAGGKEQAATMNALGLSYADLAGKTPTEQMQTFAERISSIADPAARAKAAMDIFGKSGGELLPLLSNFSGEINTARGQLGGMVDVMNRQSGVFDNVSDKLKIIGGKFMEFAAGILDKVTPALDAITEGLSRIDAAALGQKLANAFVGGENAMKGFQAAVDAFKTGNIMGALELIWESAKLQVMQTANSIVSHFTAAFNTVSDIISMMFRSDGPTIGVIESSFTALSGLISSKLYTALADFANSIGRLGMEEKFRYQAETAQRSYESAFGSISTRAELAAEDIGTNLAGAADLYTLHLESSNAEFLKTEEQAAKVAALEADINAKVAEQTTTRAATNEQLKLTGTAAEKLVQLEQAIAAAQAAGNTELVTKLERTGELLAKEAEAEAQATASKEAKREIVALETELNLAKAAGNEEAVKALEKEIETKKAKEEIAKLTQDYIKDLGVSADEAGVMATNFVNAKNAANGVKVDKTTVSAAKEEASKAAEAAKSFATWLDYIKGVDPTKGTKSLKEQTADARKEITAFGDYIGKDLKNKSFPDIARELKIDTMGKSGKEQMDEILKYISGQREKLTGIKPIDEKGSQTALDAIQKTITDFGTKSQPLNLDASKSIESIKGKLKENIDLAVNTGEGTKHLSSISGLMGDLKEIMTTLSNKLPQPALV